MFKYFAADQPLSIVRAMTAEKPFQEIVCPGKEFFKILQEPFDGYYYYASGGIELLDLQGLYTEDSLKTLTFRPHVGLGQVNFWFGRQNVTAYTHYDTSHNLHAMVQGKKKFILFQPCAYSELELHPCLHQFYRQVHTDVLDPEVFQSLRLKPVEITLNPGEVLYIPPYWFHCVITLENSISMNVWSNSASYITMESIFASPIPFEEKWGRTNLLKAVNYFLNILVHTVLGTNPEAFVKERVFSRYRPLLQHVDPAEAHRLISVVQQYCLREPMLDLLSEESVWHITDGSSDIASLFLEMQPEAVREINLGNYIEHLVWRILGTEDILLLPYFLMECF